MKTLSTVILLSILLLTLLGINIYIQASTNRPTHEVLTWWWSHGEGHEAVIFFSIGFIAFALLMSNSLLMLVEIVVAIPVKYVWLGAGLYQGTDYYYAVDDPMKNRFEVKNEVGDFKLNFSTHLDRLYQLQTLMKYGPNPEDAQFWMAYNLKSKWVRIILQYAGLIFGSIAVWQILKQFHEASGANTLSFSSTTIPFVLLIGIHMMILTLGNIFLLKKIRKIKPIVQNGFQPRKFKIGDLLRVRMLKQEKERMASGNVPFSAHYLVEWVDEQGNLLSAVIGFKSSLRLKSAIKILNKAVEKKAELECVIMDDYTLRPLILGGHGDITTL